VFYVASGFFSSTGSGCGSSCKYLEASPQSWADGGTTCGTTGLATVDPYCAWANYEYSPVVTAQATAIGTGYSNTTAIITGIADRTPNKAATAARAYTGGSKTDWSLPSKNELNELCKYARRQTTGNTATACLSNGTLRSGFAPESYWSSSQSDASYAYLQNFDFGIVSGGAKANPIWYVRPVRAF
jgi:hypothetical protein